MHCIVTNGVLLPKEHVDLKKWAVVACDQFTANPAYWNTLSQFVGDAPSALKLIYPECFLKDIDIPRIEAINDTMRGYLDAQLFCETDCVKTVRETVYGRRRTGFIFRIDLEAYDYAPDSRALIRATEGTVPERIPPRVRIRYHAPLELPHVMLLYADPDNTVLRAAGEGRLLYDTELNMRGGRVTGMQVARPAELLSAFDRLREQCTRTYGQPMLFLVGDGNHSLAAAKQCYVERKAAGLPACRYALVEAVNIYDEGIIFEPIHRLLKTADPQGFLQYLQTHIWGDGTTAAYINDTEYSFRIPAGAIDAVKAVQNVLDRYVAEHGGEIDYIHGASDLRRAAADGVGILLPAMNKSELFPYVVTNGVLPRKTFSMGEAEEKRYYLEAARIL